jgi:hypothetical protein
MSRVHLDLAANAVGMIAAGMVMRAVRNVTVGATTLRQGRIQVAP